MADDDPSLMATPLPTPLATRLQRYASHCFRAWQPQQGADWRPVASRSALVAPLGEYGAAMLTTATPPLTQSLASLWSQWHFGLLLPPLLLAALGTERYQLQPDSLHGRYERGQPSGFCGHWQPSVEASTDLVSHSLTTLITRDILRLSEQTGLTPKILWGNVAAIVDWLLLQVGDEQALALRHGLLFDEQAKPAGPLTRLMLPPPHCGQRRRCCLRFRLDEVDYCGGCPMQRTRRRRFEVDSQG
ncbi:siderophore-iron reductase FhuF [Ferrimonas sp. SCSIO 43195]|uniref:siderophore-iron reductase FhuF n=1 Tax=Ferrimonas sp. SCSIO 43195 TaxID=2822844 RepID=UPI0020763C7A|nr:siderophore-iron reductase FhuF [Ferrimonas sp. SCSIO 43195]USD39524.1 siderophore-iron reductase FhuF [Ferrimonas sp. SCSIO 43195]